MATVLEEDPLLTGFDNSKIVFTDITYGVEGIILKVNLNSYMNHMYKINKIFVFVHTNPLIVGPLLYFGSPLK